MRDFDFLVIGAMKSGTTTIHDILSKDPRIALPMSKESPFFTSKEKKRLGLECFFSRYYSGDLENKCIGKVSPQYMAWPSIASANIAKYDPNIKLIAILRDPIDRLLSHYSMSVGRGLEKRSVNKAIEDCLNMGNPPEETLMSTNSYIHRSCYGKILSLYAKEIPNINLLILGFDELVNNQASLMAKIYGHIGLGLPNDSFDNTQSLSQGGRVPFFSKLLVYLPWLAKVIVRILPHKYKGVVSMLKIEAKISMYAPKVLRSELSQENMIALQKIFDDDKYQLKELGFDAYW